MVDVMQWVIDLMTRDIALLVSGVIVLTLTVELLKSLKEWLL